MFGLIFALLLIFAFVALVFYVVDKIPVPNPFNWIIKAVAGLLAVYWAYLEVAPLF